MLYQLIDLELSDLTYRTKGYLEICKRYTSDQAFQLCTSMSLCWTRWRLPLCNFAHVRATPRHTIVAKSIIKLRTAVGQLPTCDDSITLLLFVERLCWWSEDATYASMQLPDAVVGCLWYPIICRVTNGMPNDIESTDSMWSSRPHVNWGSMAQTRIICFDQPPGNPPPA